MGELTKAQHDGLVFIAESFSGVVGPAPGWNADVLLESGGREICDGSDLKWLFDQGLISASPAPPPHNEQFNEESGSITCDHLYKPTAAGLAALEARK